MSLNYKSVRLMKPKEEGPYEIKITRSSLKNAYTFIDRFALALTVKDTRRVQFTSNALHELTCYTAFADSKNLEMINLMAAFPLAKVQQSLAMNPLIPVSVVKNIIFNSEGKETAGFISKRNRKPDVLQYLFQTYVAAVADDRADFQLGSYIADNLAENGDLWATILVHPAMNRFSSVCTKVIQHVNTPRDFIEGLMHSNRHIIHIEAMLRLVRDAPVDEAVDCYWRINKCVDECRLLEEGDKTVFLELGRMAATWLVNKQVKLIRN